MRLAAAIAALLLAAFAAGVAAAIVILDRLFGGNGPRLTWHGDGDACTGLLCGNPEHFTW